MSSAVAVSVKRLPMRTRKNVHQSKGGCYTCKARRKKCGEEKPHCERCKQARITCNGYAEDNASRSFGKALMDENVGQNMVLPARLCRSPETKPRPTRLQTLGFEVLSQEDWPDLTLTESKMWADTIRQLSGLHEVVNAAVMSLGATYEAIVLGPAESRSIDPHSVWYHYQLALSKLQTEINNHSFEDLPAFLAIVLLAAVEVLRNNLDNALLHIRGAFTLVHRHMARAESVSASFLTMIRRHPDRLVNGVDQITANICGLAQVLDVQIATYTPGDPPSLPPLPLDSILPDLHARSSLNVDLVGIQLMSLIHTCLHFASDAARYKYVSKIHVPTETIMQQSRLLAQLAQWRLSLRQRQAQPADRGISVLQAHCVSTAIYLSCVLNAHEVGYDAFEDAFQEIIDAISSISHQRPGGSVLARPSNRFRLLGSLAQPLFFTAVKCRTQMTRRKAIDLLRLTGREGPWHSQVHASVAELIVDLEEGYSQTGPATEITASELLHTASTRICEQARVCGCGIETEVQPEGFVRSITVHVSRCIDVDRMINSTSTARDAVENWNIWPEKIEFPEKPIAMVG